MTKTLATRLTVRANIFPPAGVQVFGELTGPLYVATRHSGLMEFETIREAIEHFRRTHELNINTNNGRPSLRSDENGATWGYLIRVRDHFAKKTATT